MEDFAKVIRIRMQIKTLKLIGFRNYLELDLDFLNSKTIIIGKNAQGKSNLLEVIQILSHLKSRRATKDAELINFEMEEAVIKAKVNRHCEERSDVATQKEIDISVLIRKSGRRTLKINDVGKKPKELAHNIFSVSFMVDDLEIINGSPSKRREWIDSVLNQLDYSYKDDLSQFEKILSQRNSYLKDLVEKGKYYYRDLNQAMKDQLDIWDEMFIEKANVLSQKREDFITKLEPCVQEAYRDISGSDISLNINYQGSQITKEDLEESRARDFARSYTNIGPHRDDVDFELNNSPAQNFASQGERRTLTLAIKLSELQLLKEKHGEYPILLLDDVLAELDEDRQDFLLDAIKPETQVIITTTHLGKHLEKWSGNAQILEIEQGRVIQNSSLVA